MKRFLLFIGLFFSVCVNAQIESVTPKKPNPPRLVNDFTNTLTPEQVQALESKLVAYDDSTSNQIAIVIIPTTGDYGIDEVALKVLRDWGVGNKEHNNGIVILVAINDRKVDIEVGYGLEGNVADITAKHIIDNDITPNFKKQEYYSGLDAATDDIIKAAAGEYKAPEGYNRRRKKFPFGTIIFVIIILISLFSRGGGRNGGMMSRRGYGNFWTGMILGNMLSGGGSSGSGGGWSGGGGGGFGGFGGGGGGGGGASGGW